MLRRRERLYYDRGETLLRSRGDFLMGETISCDTGADKLNTYINNIICCSQEVSIRISSNVNAFVLSVGFF